MDQPQSTVYRSIPVLLKVGLGATSIGARDRKGGVLTASWEVVGGHDVFGVVIGGPDSPVAGTLVGERYSRNILQQVIRAGGLPLPIDYQVTDRDDDLMKLVSIDGKPAWDALVAPAAEKLGISVNPGVVARNSSPGAPGVPNQSALPLPTTPPSGGLLPPTLDKRQRGAQKILEGLTDLLPEGTKSDTLILAVSQVLSRVVAGQKLTTADYLLLLAQFLG